MPHFRILSQEDTQRVGKVVFMIPTEEMISSMLAARLFGMTRAGFYRFAERHHIPNMAPFNAAKIRQEREYAFADIARVYQEIYHEELTDERLRKEAGGA